MHKNMKAISYLGIALVAAGCGNESTTAPIDVDANFRSARAPVNSVTAGGNLDLESVVPGWGIERYGFTASVDGNGNVKGQFSANWGGIKPFHMAITCLAVDGDQAWITGAVTHSPDEALPEGLNLTFQVRDNGEGRNAAPDEIGYFYGDNTLTDIGFSTDCRDMPDLFGRDGSFPMTNGSLIVR